MVSTMDAAMTYQAIFRRVFLALLVLPAGLVGQEAGTSERLLEVGNVEREYVLHLPQGYKKSQKKTFPLVVMLHGLMGTGRMASRRYGWKPLADKEGFVAVFPTAIGTPTRWKAGWRATRDSKFLAALIEAMIKEFSVDKDRVYMTGHSSGGFMSFSFAATHPDKVAAIGNVAGLMIGVGKKPKMPVSVISFHGMRDNVVAYDKEHGKKARWGRGMMSAPKCVAVFARFNGCKKKPVRTQIGGWVSGEHIEIVAHLDTWTDGDRGTRVEFYSIIKGGHGWPRSRGGRRTIAATPLIWKFFMEHGRKSGSEKAEQKHKARQKKAESQAAKKGPSR